jgi:hypothetical protein
VHTTFADAPRRARAHRRAWILLCGVALMLLMALPPDIASAIQTHTPGFLVEGSVKDMLGRPLASVSVSFQSQGGLFWTGRPQMITANSKSMPAKPACTR